MPDDAGKVIRDRLAAERAAWQDRVKAERDEVKDRVARLEGFIHSTAYYNVHDHEKGLISAQLSAMREYLNVLDQRVKFLNEAS